MRKTLGILTAVAFALLSVSGAAGEASRYKTSFFDVFDTYSEIILYSEQKAAAQEALQKAHSELLALHQLYDIYHDYEGENNLKTINDQAGVSPVKVDPRVISLIRYAQEMEEKTNGRMNIAMGSVLRIWHDYREAGLDDPANAALPDPAALQAAAEHTDIRNVVVDAEAGTVYLTDPQMSLDVGAIAKGYAVELVAQELIADGVTSALMSIGGNVRAIGARGDGTAWRVSIQNPDLTAEQQSLTTLNLADLSLVTSGSYQRYYTVNGKTYHHIIDPNTLMPAEYSWAVSVLTQDSRLADALSTALFNLSIEDGITLLKGFPGVEALWVTLDGQIVRSEGFAALSGEENTGG